MTAVRGHSLLRRFRPDRPDVLVLFMALLLKSWHCCSSHGIAAQVMALLLKSWHCCSSHGIAAQVMALLLKSWHCCSSHGIAAQGMALLLKSWHCCSSHGIAAQVMALLLKSWHCCSSHGIAAQAGLDGTHERTSWNMQRSPCACSMSAVAETADAGLRSRHVHAAAAISVCRREKTTQWRIWPDTPGSTAS